MVFSKKYPSWPLGIFLEERGLAYLIKSKNASLSTPELAIPTIIFVIIFDRSKPVSRDEITIAVKNLLKTGVSESGDLSLSTSTSFKKSLTDVTLEFSEE